MPDNDEKSRAFLVSQLKKLCMIRYARDDGPAWERLFADFSGPDGQANRDELTELLKAAEVGGAFRGLWVTRLLDSLDKDNSNSISLEEMNRAIATNTPPASILTAPAPKPITRAEAAVIARAMAGNPKATFEWESFSKADMALIEEENLKLTSGQFGTPGDSDSPAELKKKIDRTAAAIEAEKKKRAAAAAKAKAKSGAKKPPPPPPAKPSPIAEQVVIGVIVGVLSLFVMKSLGR
jgi:hypothetical protein